MDDNTQGTGLAEAIAKVMSEVKQLPKEERHSQGGYDFTSIDAFMEFMRPICSKAGLAIIQDEKDFEFIDGKNAQGKPSMSTRVTYEFTLMGKDGATLGPFTRSIVTYGATAQAFGAAQSYCWKQFVRSLFQISTGDKEDEDTQKEGLVSRGQSTGPDLQKEANRIANAIKSADTTEDVKQVLAANGPVLEEIKTKSESAYGAIIDRAREREDRIRSGDGG